VLAALAATGVFSAFSSQTDNPGNVVTAGTVTLSDDDGGSALYSLTAAKPGDSATSCIEVTYDDTLDDFAAAHSGYANGLADDPGTSATAWTTDDSVVYRVTATLAADTPADAQGDTTGAHALRWEARNQ
jgi:hypothetical protein